jgi:hypothetical protein
MAATLSRMPTSGSSVISKMAAVRGLSQSPRSLSKSAALPRHMNSSSITGTPLATVRCGPLVIDGLNNCCIRSKYAGVVITSGKCGENSWRHSLPALMSHGARWGISIDKCIARSRRESTFVGTWRNAFDIVMRFSGRQQANAYATEAMSGAGNSNFNMAKSRKVQGETCPCPRVEAVQPDPGNRCGPALSVTDEVSAQKKKPLAARKIPFEPRVWGNCRRNGRHGMESCIAIFCQIRQLHDSRRI